MRHLIVNTLKTLNANFTAHAQASLGHTAMLRKINVSRAPDAVAAPQLRQMHRMAETIRNPGPSHMMQSLFLKVPFSRSIISSCLAEGSSPASLSPPAEFSTSASSSSPSMASTTFPASKETQSDKQNASSSVSATDLKMASAVFVLPHPEKTARGGEDWYFIADNNRSIGIADGVGGWADVGVDAGAYARQLMNGAKEEAEADTFKQPDNTLSAASILQRAYERTTYQGSCTACVLVLNGANLTATNLGDSGYLILRGQNVVYKSAQQQHDFNFPYQMGHPGSNSDKPSDAQLSENTVQPGDIIVLGTDGLWDNCHEEEIIQVITFYRTKRESPDKAAQAMAHYARHRAADDKFPSPFALSAHAAGIRYMGGKMDDITVVVAYVQQAASKL